MFRSSLTKATRAKQAYAPGLTSSTFSSRYASGTNQVKGNATGLAPGTADGMKPGKDNISKEPVDKQDKTPNVEGGEGEDAHPAKRPAKQPEPTRSTGIKGKEEMG